VSRDLVKNWFVFGGYADPAFNHPLHKGMYNPNAPCDVADVEGDVFTRIPYPIAQKLIAARDEFIAKIEAIEQEYPDLKRRCERIDL